MPLGGVGEIGMNLGLYGYGHGRNRTWLAVDMGVAFGHDDLPGVDAVLPDIRFLLERQGTSSPASSSPTRTRTITARSTISGRSSRCPST